VIRPLEGYRLVGPCASISELRKQQPLRPDLGNASEGKQEDKKRKSKVKVTWGHFFVLPGYHSKGTLSSYFSPNFSLGFSQQETAFGQYFFSSHLLKKRRCVNKTP